MKKKYNKIFLKGEKIYLRKLVLKDVNKKYLSWMFDKNNSYIPAASYTKTMDSLKKYVKKKLNNSSVLFFAIIDIESGTHIGNIKMEPINWASKTASFGRLIGHRDFKKKGYGTEATKIILKFAFEILNLKKISSYCLKENIAAIKSNTKNGMSIKKNTKNKQFIKNKWRTLIELRISKKDWNNRKK